MTAQQVVRAWKDVRFRHSRGSDNLPTSPVGILDFEELAKLVEQDDGLAKPAAPSLGAMRTAAAAPASVIGKLSRHLQGQR